MDKVVNLISLGCAKNLVDSEILLGGMDKSNLTITKNPEEAKECELAQRNRGSQRSSTKDSTGGQRVCTKGTHRKPES